MKKKSHEALNENKLKEAYEKYVKAREAKETFETDPEARTKYIDFCFEKGVIAKELKVIETEEQWSENARWQFFTSKFNGVYSKNFGLYVWEHVYLLALDFDKQGYDVMDFLVKDDLKKLR